MYEYNAKIINIVDGDTFDLDVDLGFRLSYKIRVRLLGIDTPEKRGLIEKKLGLICTNYAQKFLNEEVVIKSKKEEDLETDSFGRWLVEIYFKDGKSILDIYNELGINKLNENYSIENVLKLS